MRGRIVFVLFALFLALALRRDLADLAVRQGDAKLLAGDAAGAAMSYGHAISIGHDAAPLAYNLGVSLYRQGDYLRARDRFAAATAMAAAVSHYNLGNCLFRLGERAAGDREQARRYYLDAVSEYGMVSTPDAAANRNLARMRLAALAGAGENAGNRERQRAGEAGRPAGGDAIPRQGGGQGQAAGAKDSTRGATRAERPHPAAAEGKSRYSLTRQEAERLLSEARGRERPAGLLQERQQALQTARPERDW